MSKNLIKAPAIFLFIIALSGWFALISQLYIIIENRVVSVSETIVRYFSFFTILTNIMVALCATVLLLSPVSKPGKFFAKASTLTAIGVYIVVVGVVYNTILRFLWQPQGLQYVVDELLHTFIPVLFILFWILYMPKDGLKYTNAMSWLLYPLVYLLYTALHGEISGYYPYPFINVIELGYKRVFINALILLFVFLGLSLFLIAVGKYRGRKTK